MVSHTRLLPIISQEEKSNLFLYIFPIKKQRVTFRLPSVQWSIAAIAAIALCCRFCGSIEPEN